MVLVSQTVFSRTEASRRRNRLFPYSLLLPVKALKIYLLMLPERQHCCLRTHSS